jgi:hypothetical protein
MTSCEDGQQPFLTDEQNTAEPSRNLSGSTAESADRERFGEPVFF